MESDGIRGITMSISIFSLALVSHKLLLSFNKR